MTSISTLNQLVFAAGIATVALTGCNKQDSDTNPGGTPAASATTGDAGASAPASTAAPAVDNHSTAPAVTPGTSGGTSEANGHNTNTGTGVGTTHTGAAGGPDTGTTPAQPQGQK